MRTSICTFPSAPSPPSLLPPTPVAKERPASFVAPHMPLPALPSFASTHSPERHTTGAGLTPRRAARLCVPRIRATARPETCHHPEPSNEAPHLHRHRLHQDRPNLARVLTRGRTGHIRGCAEGHPSDIARDIARDSGQDCRMPARTTWCRRPSVGRGWLDISEPPHRRPFDDARTTQPRSSRPSLASPRPGTSTGPVQPSSSLLTFWT